ncbi:MAG: recombinase family protein [Gemmatimonadaceae bacterium]
MAEGKYISYLRVSTKRQGDSGLGLEAQRRAVEAFLNGGNWKLLAEYVEIESGRRSDRPELAKALSECRMRGASLVVAKIDRLARNTRFLLEIAESGVDLVFCDLPSASKFTIGIMAMVAEEEARMISARTKDALQAAKRRGVVLGKPENLTNAARLKGTVASAGSRRQSAARWLADVAPIVRELFQDESMSLRRAAQRMNERTLPTRRGRGPWTATQILRVMRSGS